MALEHLFQGSALNAVDAKGRVSVPAFLRQVIERASAIGFRAVKSAPQASRARRAKPKT